MLIDPGSSINLIPQKTLDRLTLKAHYYTKDKIVIHGFNHKSEQSIGSIDLCFNIGGISERMKFYIIDADTTYNALIGRPWLHRNNAVPSTLHQCVKYVRDGKVKRINGEMKPFEVHEVGLRDAKYFMDVPGRKGKYQKKQQDKPILYGEDTESSSGEDADETRVLPSYIPSSDDECKVSQSALAIELVPKNHHKALIPREISKMQEFKTFVVPPKKIMTDMGTIKQGPILFYRVSDDGDNTSPADDNTWSEEHILDQTTDVPLPAWCSKNLHKLMKKSCSMSTTVLKKKEFERMITPYRGKSDKRGLGYDGPDLSTQLLINTDNDTDDEIADDYQKSLETKANTINQKMNVQGNRGKSRAKARGFVIEQSQNMRTQTNEENCYMASQKSTDSEDASPRKEENHSDDSSSKKVRCDYCDEVKSYYAMFQCDRCRRYSCPHCETGRNIVAGCDERFFNWLCQPCKYARKQEQEKQKTRGKGKRKMPEPKSSSSSQDIPPKKSGKPTDAQGAITGYSSDSGSSTQGPECFMVEHESDRDETESDSCDEESEFECDSEGNLPSKKAFCAECKGEGDYWVMFECHRCLRTFHPPCLNSDRKEAVAMDHRYDSYICSSCEALHIYKNSKKRVNADQGGSSSTLYEEKFGEDVLCYTCEEQGNSWDMFECSECCENNHPSCATPSGERVEANDMRFDHYECQKCIGKQVQAQIEAIGENEERIMRPHWATEGHKGTSLNKARIQQQAKMNVGNDYCSAHEAGRLPKYEKEQLVWVVKEITRLMSINSWGPYMINQVLGDHRYKLINQENGTPTKPVSGRYLKPYQTGDNRDACYQEYLSDS